MKNVKIYAREIVSPPGAKLAFSAPSRPDVDESPAATGQSGKDGHPGKNGGRGVNGPWGKS